jgi:hypothetical protein
MNPAYNPTLLDLRLKINAAWIPTIFGLAAANWYNKDWNNLDRRTLSWRFKQAQDAGFFDPFPSFYYNYTSIKWVFRNHCGGIPDLME